MLRYFLPLVIFAALVALFAVGLNRDPRLVPSPFIDKPAPAFRLDRLEQPGRILDVTDLRGQVVLINVWASWCTACRAEHPLLLALAREGRVPIYGLNYKDRRQEALAWLARLGNPYVASGFDAEGRVGVDWGVYGVPETFLLDRRGIVRYKHVGPLTEQVWREHFEPRIARLEAQS